MPDLPLEETAIIRAAASAAGIQLTMLCTPTTPELRMKAIAGLSEGFVYLVSVAGACTVYDMGLKAGTTDASSSFWFHGSKQKT